MLYNIDLALPMKIANNIRQFVYLVGIMKVLRNIYDLQQRLTCPLLKVAVQKVGLFGAKTRTLLKVVRYHECLIFGTLIRSISATPAEQVRENTTRMRDAARHADHGTFGLT